MIYNYIMVYIYNIHTIYVVGDVAGCTNLFFSTETGGCGLPHLACESSGFMRILWAKMGLAESSRVEQVGKVGDVPSGND